MDSILSATWSTTHILDLNDDCLREVFGVLDVSYLAVAADVCYRFRPIAQSHFAGSKYRTLKLHELYPDGESEEESLKRASRIFRNFGASIESFDGIGTYFAKKGMADHRISEVLCRYCSELSELKLHRFRIADGPKKFISSISSLKNLKILQLDAVMRLDLRSEFLKFCENLNELTELYFNRETHVLIEETLVKLIRNSPKLRFLQYDQNRATLWPGKHRPFSDYVLEIRATTYEQLAAIAESRGMHLKIDLLSVLEPQPISYLEALDKAHEDLLTITYRRGTRRVYRMSGIKIT